MKQYITTLHSATAAICTAALVATIAACTATEPLPATLPTTTDPLTALAPTTPVGIAATLKPYGNGTATRTATTTHAHLQAIPAAGEITPNTPLEDAPEPRPINRTHAPANATRANATPTTPARASLQLPGAKEEDNTDLFLYNDGSTYTVGNIGSAPLYTDDHKSPEQLNSNGTLKLKNFNLSPTTTAGASQPHSRIGILRLYTNVNFLDADELMAIAPITTGVDPEGTPTATMPFTLKHTGAKVSVLLVTPDNTPIDATTTATLNSAHIAVRRARAYFIYTGTGNPTAGYPLLFHYLRGEPNDATYPHDPTPLATNTALALIASGTGDTEDFSLAHPATASADATPTVPTNLINGLIPACPTHSSNTYYTPLDTPRPYQPDEALILKMNIATGQGTPTKEVTYTLPLTSIALTGLPDGDPRINPQGTQGTGTLTYLRPGEHLVLTVTVDTDLQTITASATVGAWSTGTATGTPTEQPTGAAPTE